MPSKKESQPKAGTAKKTKKKEEIAEQPVVQEEEEVKEQPKVKLNTISADALQKEISSISLGKGLEIQRARRVYRTGSIGMDAALGKRDPIKRNGGIPELAILEVYGRTGVRKSNFVEHLAFNILEDDPNNIVVFLYTEDPDLERLYRECRRRGLPESTIYSRFQILGLYNPESPEAKLNSAEKRLMDLVEASKYDNVKLLVIDSLKALVSVTQMFKKGGETKETTKPFEEDEVAIRAKLMEKLFNRLLFQRRSAILAMTNQLTERIPNFSDRFVINNGQDRTPAGTLKEFLSVIRIHAEGKPLYEEEKLKITGDKDSEHCPQAGILQIYKIKKNRWGRPNVRVVVPFDFETGKYDNSLEALTLGNHVGVIERRGASWYFPDGHRATSKDDALLYLDANPEVMEQVYLAILDVGADIYKVRPGEKRGNISAQDILEPSVEAGTSVDTETGEVLYAEGLLSAEEILAGAVSDG